VLKVRISSYKKEKAMRRYFVEAMGTFFLTLVISFSSFTGNPIPMGLMFMAMIYIGYHISGAHYNPAVSLAVFLRNRISLHDMFMYMASQVVGALLALGLFTFLYDTVFSPEVPLDMPLIFPLGMEALLTFVLVLVVLTVCLLERYRTHAIQGVVVGLTLIAIASIGGIFNPAVALAALVLNMVKDGSFVGLYPIAIYLVGPLLGGFAASHVYAFLNEH
jgi:glycerol uptake facilitator-like aquaporin